MASQSVRTILLILAVLGALGAVLFSPWALDRVGVDNDVNWTRLSELGQTYGAASAVLSALALVGVAVSLVLQGKETKASRDQALRALHADLLKMALEDPLYLSCFGPFGGDDPQWQRQHVFSNLIVSHWQLMWETGALNEGHLRALGQQFFSGRVGRRFWGEGGDVRKKVEGGRRARRFHQILDEVYQHTVVQQFPSRPAPHTAGGGENTRAIVGALVCLAAAAGAAAALRRRRR